MYNDRAIAFYGNRSFFGYQGKRFIGILNIPAEIICRANDRESQTWIPYEKQFTKLFFYPFCVFEGVLCFALLPQASWFHPENPQAFKKA